MSAYIALLKQRVQYRRLWSAQVISLLGDWFNTIASVILVNRYTESGLAVGALFLARSLPPLFVGPVAGVVADRIDRRLILILADFTRVFIVLGFLFINSPDRIWLIYVLSIAQFSVSAFDEPARAAILPSLVKGDDELLIANTLSSATWSALLALGSALGGFTTALFGVRAAIIIDALTFALSGTLLLRISADTRPPRDMSNPVSGFTDYIDGLRYIIRNPGIAMVSLVKGMNQIGSVDVVIALYAAQIFTIGEDGAVAIGLMFMFNGIGSVLGPFIGNMVGSGKIPFLRRAITVGFVMLMGSWLLASVAPTLPILLVGMFFRGMGTSLNWTYSTVLIQMRVPGKFLGRIFAFDFGFFTLMLSLSILGMSAAVDRFGLSPRELTFAMGVISVIPLALWLWYTSQAGLPPPREQENEIPLPEQSPVM